METYQIDSSAIGQGKLFPQHIEGRDWMGYHGTSSLYSTDIEARGFIQSKPIDTADIDLVAGLMRKNGLDASDVEGFKGLRSISFSPNSELSLAYCAPSTRAGQGMSFVKSAIIKLQSAGHTPISPDEKTKLVLINDRIDSIASAEPVVYAVNLQGLSIIEYSTVTKAVHVFEAVSPERIVAKMKVDKAVDFSSIDVKRLKQQLHDLFWSARDHYIRRIRR